MTGGDFGAILLSIKVLSFGFAVGVEVALPAQILEIDHGIVLEIKLSAAQGTCTTCFSPLLPTCGTENVATHWQLNRVLGVRIRGSESIGVIAYAAAIGERVGIMPAWVRNALV